MNQSHKIELRSKTELFQSSMSLASKTILERKSISKLIRDLIQLKITQPEERLDKGAKELSKEWLNFSRSVLMY